MVSQGRRALHDSAAKGVAGAVLLRTGLGHDAAAERVAGAVLVGLGLGHDGAAKGVAGRVGGGVLGGRHNEGWG